MRYRNSLRFRIFAAFLGAGLLLGPALALVFLVVATELEESTTARLLTGRLEQLMAAPEQDPPATHTGAPEIRVFGELPPARMPAELRGRTGIYEIDPGNHAAHEGPLPSAMRPGPDSRDRSWVLAVGSRGPTTFVVAADRTSLEHRDSTIGWVIAGGTLLSVCLSMWFGYHFTGRLVTPLHRLAAATSAAGSEGANALDAADYPPDEIGQLAAALQRDRAGMSETLDREKAFSAEVAHELRNPLAVIQGTMEILERDTGLAPLSGRALARALGASREMTEALGALLFLGRPSAAALPEIAQDVATVARSLVDRYSAQGSTAVAWEQVGAPQLHAPEPIIRMVADNLFRSVLQNVGSGRLEVSLMADRLIVRHSRVGTPPPAPEPAVSDEPVTTRRGLGAALVDRVCDRFGWSTSIERRTDGTATATWLFR